MSVSVVVISLNSPMVNEVLKSLHNQSVEPFEIILVEAGELKEWPQDVTVIQDLGGNQSHSRNLGAKHSKGDFIAYLDSDCVAPVHWIHQIGWNIARGMKAFGGPYIPEQQTDFARDSHRALSRFIGASPTFADKTGGVRAVRSISGGNCVYSRELLEKTGGFDERQHWREEPELGRKVRELGTEILFDPEMWVWHRWKGWNGLIPLARQGYFYGRIRVKSQREIEH